MKADVLQTRRSIRPSHGSDTYDNHCKIEPQIVSMSRAYTFTAMIWTTRLLVMVEVAEVG
jgi:hypothetical protein